MPNLSSHKTSLAAPGHKVRAWCVFMSGVVVMTANVTAAPTYPTKTLNISVVSGSASNVRHNFTLVVETPGGQFKGRLRVASAGTISGTEIPVNEFSRARVDVQTGDVVKVYNFVALEDKLVGDTSDFLPDGRITYANQTLQPAPLICSGGSFVKRLDPGQNYATAHFDGSASQPLDFSSTGLLAHLWVKADDSPLTFAPGSSSIDVSPVVRLPAGYTLIAHKVVDTTSAAAATHYVPCYVVDDAAHPAYECMCEINGSPENGWSANIELYSAAGLGAVPDGCAVAVFVEETINNVDGSFGAAVSSRSHIKFWGYISSDTNELNWKANRLRFSAVSPIARLEMLPGFSKVMFSKNNPAAWSEIKALTTIRAIAFLLRYYSTWTDTLDLVLPLDDRLYPAFYLQKQTPYGQVRELADGLDMRFVCDRTGRGEVHVHLPYTPLSARSSMTTTLTLDANDVIDMSFERTHYRQVETLEGRGFTAGGNPQPVFARYPGNAPGGGNQSLTAEKMIVDSQEELNERTGRRGALADGVFVNASGVERKQITLRLSLYGSFDVFDFYREWITLDFNGFSNLRRIALSDFRWWLKSSAVRYDRGTARVELELVSETNGLPAESYFPPMDDAPPVDVPPPEIVIPTFPSIPGGGEQNIALFARI